MKTDDLVKRADMLIAMANAAMQNTYDMNGLTMVNGAVFNEFRSASLSFLRNLFGEDHPYFTGFKKVMNGSWPHSLERGRGVLQAARDELAGGWLVDAKALLAADIFGDFLEMAEYLLKEQYKDPAAVLIGSVLEDHLRRLAKVHALSTTFPKDGRDVPKKADTLNSEIAKAGVYGTLDQKNVTAWLDLRNKAAHGRYLEYTADHVELMLQGVRVFISRFLA